MALDLWKKFEEGVAYGSPAALARAQERDIATRENEIVTAILSSTEVERREAQGDYRHSAARPPVHGLALK